MYAVVFTAFLPNLSFPVGTLLPTHPAQDVPERHVTLVACDHIYLAGDVLASVDLELQSLVYSSGAMTLQACWTWC